MCFFWRIGINKKRRDVAEKVLSTIISLTLDPTGGLVGKGALSMVAKFIPDPDFQQKIDGLKCDLARRIPKRLHQELIANTAVKILETQFRGTRDLYKAREDPEKLSRTLLDRHASRLLSKADREKVCALLTGLFESYRAFSEVIDEIERIFREDVLGRLDVLQESINEGLRPLLEVLIRWTRTDILYDPCERLRRTSDPAPSFLLDARYETVPFFGRKKELGAFEEWLDADEPFSVWTVAGAGGLGKTRLMLEIATRARGKGWRAGFLKRDVERRDVEAGAEALAGGPQNVLAVVDYAEDRPGLAATLMVRWWRDGGPKHRLVLVTRNVDDVTNAIERLCRDDEAFREVVAVLKSATTHRLKNLSLSLPERRKIFAHAQGAFLKKLKPPSEKVYDVDLLEDAYFDQPHFENTLFLHIAALSSLNGRPLVRRTDLLAFVLKREWNFLERLFRQNPKLGKSLNGKDIAETLARATLAMGARPEAASVDAAPTLNDLLQDTDAGESISRLQLQALKNLLAHTYPSRNGDERHMDALRPDPLGEALVFEVLEDRPALLDFALAQERDDASRVSAVRVLLRTALAFAPNAPSAWLEERLCLSMALRFDKMPELFLNQIPLSSVGFRRLAAKIAERQTEAARASLSADSDNESTIATYASALVNLGNRYSKLGQHEDALGATEEARGLYRTLAQQNPDAFNPNLASALNNLGIRYSEFGRREDALKATEEAAGLYRTLAQKNPAAFNPDLASALINLGTRLSECRRPKEGLDVAKESIALYRSLEGSNHHAFAANLALALNNNSNRFLSLNYDEDALKAAREAVNIYRSLAPDNPDAINPDLARALTNLANAHACLGQSKAALKSAKEAVDIRRKLAESNPQAFHPDLAKSLAALGAIHLSVDNWPSAVEALAEGIGLLKPYFLRLPQAFGELMSSLLFNYSNACTQGRLEMDEALIQPLLPYLAPPNEEEE